MRIPRQSLLFLSLLTAFCLLGGVVIGIATGEWGQPRRPRPSATPTTLLVAVASEPLGTPTPTPIITPGPQKSILIIGVSSAESGQAALEGCWVLTFTPGVPHYYLLGFPPTARFHVASLASQETLGDIFAEDQRLQLDHRLLRDAVQTRFPALAIEADLVLAREDMARLVTALGGVGWNGQRYDAESLLAAYEAQPAADPTARLTFQGQALHAAFLVMGEQGWTPADVVEHLAAVERFQGDAEVLAMLESFAAGAPPLAESEFTWRLYTPELEVSSAP